MDRTQINELSKKLFEANRLRKYFDRLLRESYSDAAIAEKVRSLRGSAAENEAERREILAKKKYLVGQAVVNDMKISKLTKQMNSAVKKRKSGLTGLMRLIRASKEARLRVRLPRAKRTVAKLRAIRLGRRTVLQVKK
jgi:hypothetical protein